MVLGDGILQYKNRADYTLHGHYASIKRATRRSPGCFYNDSTVFIIFVVITIPTINETR